MFKKVFLLFILLGMLYSANVRAQDRVLHGIVTTFDSIPLIGASVKVQSTKQVALTDSLGMFSVGCNNNDKLKVSASGFFNQKVNVKEKIRFVAVNLHLKPGEKNRQIAIGYGYINDKNKLSAISTLNDDEFDYNRYQNILDLIQSRFAGVQVVDGEIIIRGKNSILSSNAALIVVDGVISDNSILSTIKPIDVKSINIIKDGSTAIYGSRGANGVVIIDTKRGGD